jgi:hypothetical protein
MRAQLDFPCEIFVSFVVYGVEFSTRLGALTSANPAFDKFAGNLRYKVGLAIAGQRIGLRILGAGHREPPLAGAATRAEFKKQPPCASRSQSSWIVRNIQRDQRNAAARRIRSKGMGYLRLKIPEFDGRIAGTSRDSSASRGLAIRFSLFLTPLFIKNEDGIFPALTATEREKPQQ